MYTAMYEILKQALLTNWMGDPTSRSEFGHSATSSSHHQGNKQPDTENLIEFSPTKSGQNVWNKADKGTVNLPPIDR